MTRAPAATVATSDGLTVTFNAEALRQIVEEVVTEMLERFSSDQRVAYPEAEAAHLLGIPRHSLRDARLRCEVKASKVGSRWLYSRAQLLEFLRNREEAR